MIGVGGVADLREKKMNHNFCMARLATAFSPLGLSGGGGSELALKIKVEKTL